MHRTSYTYTTEQQCNETHQIQEGAKIAKSRTNTLLAALHRIPVELGFFEALFQWFYECIRVGRFRQFEKILIVYPASALYQAGTIQPCARNKDHRCNAAGNARPPRRREQIAFNSECDVSDLNTITRFNAKLKH